MKANKWIAAMAGLSAIALATPAYSENWVYVTEDKTSDGDDFPPYKRKFYIDTDSVVKLQNSVKIWQTYTTPDRKDPVGRPFAQDRRRYFLFEYDCEEKTKTILRYDRFEEIVLDFSVTWDSNTQRSESIIAGSLDEKIFWAVCALK